MLKTSTIVLETNILNIDEVEQDLINYSKLYSSLERKLFNQLKDKEISRDMFKDFQKTYIAKHHIHARVFKTLWKQVLGRVSSIKLNQQNHATNRETKIKELKTKLKSIRDEFKRFRVISKINRLTQLNKKQWKVRSTWGSRDFFHKQWRHENHEKWLEEWRIRRDHNIFIIGASCEPFGNSLCQLQTLQKLRLTLPHSFDKKHLTLQVDFDKKKKIYQYLKTAITNKKAISVRIFQSSKNRKWYVQLFFSIENECEDHCNGTIGVDINYNLISICSVRPDGNGEDFTDYRFEVDDNNKDKNNQIFSDVVNQLVDRAVKEKKTITIEKISLKNKLKGRKISLVCYRKFISFLTVRCIKMGVLLLEVNPAYTSVIGRLKYSKPLGRSTHSCASLTVGRRGLEHVEKIPSNQICLLQSEERDKSLLTQWGILNKRLKKVSPEERSSCLLGHRDQTTFNLNSCQFSLLTSGSKDDD